MTQRQLSAAEIDLHDLTFRRGCELVKHRLLINGTRSGILTWLGKRRLKKAVELFKATLKINPSGWPAMWNLGKIYQRLGDHSEALAWFRRAHELKPDQPDVAREAGLEALEVGDYSTAKSYLESAIQSNPDDPGLVANLALAELLGGDAHSATRLANDAVARNPSDRISKAVARLADRVRSGKCHVPRSMAELRRLA